MSMYIEGAPGDLQDVTDLPVGGFESGLQSEDGIPERVTQLADHYDYATGVLEEQGADYRNGSPLVRAIRLYRNRLTQYTTECPNTDVSCSQFGEAIARAYPMVEAVGIIRERIQLCGAVAMAGGHTSISECSVS